MGCEVRNSRSLFVPCLCSERKPCEHRPCKRGESAVAPPNPLESQLEELLQPKTGEKTWHHLQYIALSGVQITGIKGMQQGY